MLSIPAINFDSPYDCIVIGGGPAGLTCAIFLGRYTRRVLVIDSGQPRNYASRGIHGFLGQQGIKPHELLVKGCAEATEVGVEFLEGTATNAELCGDMFEVKIDGRTARARRLVLAYGVRDLKPDIPEFERFYGASVYHCPDCDGYETRGKKIGIIGHGRRVAGLTLKLLQWSSDLTIFTNGHELEVEKEEMSKLLAEGVGFEKGRIIELIGRGPQIERVKVESGTAHEIQAMFFTIGAERTTDLAEKLGCEVYDDAPCIKVDEHRQTSVEGVWAIGDLAPGAQLAITSAADGAIAAIAINKSLMPPGKRV